MKTFNLKVGFLPALLLPALIILLLSEKVCGQSPKPLPDKTVIQIDVDETGKITNQQAGFQLKEGNTYDYKINIAPPLNQQKALLKYLKTQLSAIYGRLVTSSDPVHINYAKLFPSPTDFDNYTDEIKNLTEILTGDPLIVEKKLATTAYKFLNFNETAFLKDALFGQTFTVTVEMNSKVMSVKTKKWNEIIDLELTGIKHVIDRSNLVIRVNDLKKQFLINYFNKSLATGKIDSLLKLNLPSAFYQSVVRNDLVNLLQEKQTILQTLIDAKNPATFFCLATSQNIKDLKSNYSNDLVVKILGDDWLKKWAWFTEGVIKLNPFDFTDPDKILLPEGYDKKRAEEMDAYVKIAMKRMLTPELKEPISTTKFDSLNRLSGNGKELYSLEKNNPLLIKQNKDKLASFQEVKKKLDSLSFLVAQKKGGREVYLKTYDASQTLLKSPQDNLENLPLDTRIQLMAYNVASTDTFKVVAKDIVITDDNVATRGISEAAAGLTLATTQGATAFTLFQTITSALKPKNSTVKVAISPSAKNNSAAALGNKSLVVTTVKLRLKKAGSLVKIFTIDSHDDEIEQNDITTNIKSTIGEILGNDCAKLQLPIENAVVTGLGSYEETFTGNTAGFLAFQEAFYEKVKKQIKAVINKVAAAEAKRLYVAIQYQTPLLDIAANMLNKGFLVIPPETLTMENAGAKPEYVTSYKFLEQKTGPTKIDLTLSYVYKDKAREGFSKIDEQTQSPPHYISPSLGVTSIFGKFSRSDVMVTDGVITNTPDEDRIRILAGVNIYPFPILYTDNRFIGSLEGRDLASRFSIFLGCSFPKPLYNPQVGLTVEPWAGIKLTGGLHWYRKTYYKITNDQIEDENARYTYNSAFIALTIDPIKFVSILSSIKL